MYVCLKRNTPLAIPLMYTCYICSMLWMHLFHFAKSINTVCINRIAFLHRTSLQVPCVHSLPIGYYHVTEDIESHVTIVVSDPLVAISCLQYCIEHPNGADSHYLSWYICCEEQHKQAFLFSRCFLIFYTMPSSDLSIFRMPPQWPYVPLTADN